MPLTPSTWMLAIRARARSTGANAPVAFDLREDPGELLPADPRDELAGARRRRQVAADVGQDPVADLMAVGVVDGLEVVEVEDDEGQEVPVAPGALDLAVEALREGAPVRQAGERVGLGQPRQLGARLGVGDGDRRELGERGQAALGGRPNARGSLEPAVSAPQTRPAADSGAAMPLRSPAASTCATDASSGSSR